MTKKTEKTDNPPAVKDETFTFSAVADQGLKLSAEIMAEITEEDQIGYEPEEQSFPIVSIRNKPLLDKGGRTVHEAGGLKIYDPVSAEQEIQIADVSSLLVNILGDQSARVYFKTGVDKPVCQSVDGKHGIGDPGGACETCEFGQLRDGSRSECTAQKHVLVHDVNSGNCYALRLSPSGLKPYRMLKIWAKREGKVLHAFNIRVGTKYMSDPQPHFIPEFHVEGMVQTIEEFRDLKEIRKVAVSRLGAAVEVVETDSTDSTYTTDYAGFLPDDVNPLQGGTNGRRG